jgi:hypothetical protein
MGGWPGLFLFQMMECNLKILLQYIKLHSLQIINYASISCSNKRGKGTGKFVPVLN